MPRPRRRLDLLFLPADPERPVDPAAFAALQHRWAGLGWLARGHDAPAGGFQALRLDDPGRVAFYANQLGGFRVSCPDRGVSVVPAFNAAMTAWRAGGDRSMVCPACSEQHVLEGLAFAPQAGFARGAVVLADVERGSVRAPVRAEVEAVTGPSRLVLRRPS